MRFLVILLMGLPLPAFALSCLPHGVSDAYIEADQARESYVPVLGDLSFDTKLLPEVDMNNQQGTPQKTLIPATFRGKALSPRGVSVPFETDVMLEVRCFGPWCPSPLPGRSLGFLLKTSDSYVLSTNACGGFLFGQPTNDQVKEAEDCLAGRRCEPWAQR